METYYTKENFPSFVCNDGPWDIYRNDYNYCAAIPTDQAAREGHLPSHFGDIGYVRATLGYREATL
jgi:hypothetical protein